MEKIFETYKRDVVDGGFSDSVIEKVAFLHNPTRNSYRVPTLIAAAASAVIIIAITTYIGLPTLNEKYNDLRARLSWNAASGTPVSERNIEK